MTSAGVTTLSLFAAGSLWELMRFGLCTRARRLHKREVVQSGACDPVPTCWLYTGEIPEGRFLSDRAKDQPSIAEL